MIGRHRGYTAQNLRVKEIRERLEKLLEVARFLEKVGDPDKNGCWPWLGCITHENRGLTQMSTSFRWRGRSVPAPRAVVEMFFRDLKKGEFVCHECDNRICVNPDHLFIGTHEDNILDKTFKGRAARKLTPDLVREIRKAVGGQDEIAARFGVGQASVSAIKTGRTWGWLKD